MSGLRVESILWPAFQMLALKGIWTGPKLQTCQWSFFVQILLVFFQRFGKKITVIAICLGFKATLYHIWQKVLHLLECF